MLPSAAVAAVAAAGEGGGRGRGRGGAETVAATTAAAAVVPRCRISERDWRKHRALEPEKPECGRENSQAHEQDRGHERERGSMESVTRRNKKLDSRENNEHTNRDQQERHVNGNEEVYGKHVGAALVSESTAAWPPQGLVLGQAPGPRCSKIPLAGRAEQRLCVLTGLDPESFRRAFECRNLLPFFPGSQRCKANGNCSSSNGRTSKHSPCWSDDFGAQVLRGRGGTAKRKRAGGTGQADALNGAGIGAPSITAADKSSPFDTGGSQATANCGELGPGLVARSMQAGNRPSCKTVPQCIAEKEAALGDATGVAPWKQFARVSAGGTKGANSDDAKKGDHFPLSDARANLQWQASQGLFEERRLIILLGTKVAAAIGFAPCRRLFDAAWATIDSVSGMPRLASSSCHTIHDRVRASNLLDPRWVRERFTLVIVFPHPSGVSHYWNTAANVCRAQRFMAAAIEQSRVLRPPQIAPTRDRALFRSARVQFTNNQDPRENPCSAAEIRRVSRFFIRCRCSKHRVWCTKCCLSPERLSKYFGRVETGRATTNRPSPTNC